MMRQLTLRILCAALACLSGTGVEGAMPPLDARGYDSLVQVVEAKGAEAPGEAALKVEEAIEAWENDLTDAQMASLLVLEGVMYYQAGKTDRAISAHREGLRYARSVNAPGQLAEIYRNLGSIFLRLQQLDSADHYLAQSFELLPSDQFRLERAETHFLSGMSKSQQGLPDADEHLQLAFDLYQELEMPLKAANAIQAYAVFTGRIGKPHEGIPYLQKAIKIFRQEQHPQAEATGYLNLGSLYLSDGRYDSALDAFQTALKRFESLSDSSQLGQLYYNIGAVYDRLEQSDAAIPNYRKALTLIDTAQATRTYEWLCLGLAYNLNRIGQPRKAFTHMERAYDLLNERFANQQSQANMKLQRMLQEETILRDQIRNEKDLVEAKLQRTWLLVGVIVLVLLLVVAGLMVRNYQRERALQRRELAQQKAASQQAILALMQDQEADLLNAMLEGQDQERSRIAADLHDSLGGTLSAVQVSLSMIQAKMQQADPRTLKTYERTRKLLDDAYDDVRRISHDMADNSLRQGGLEEALQQLADTLRRANYFQLKMEITGLSGQRLENAVEVQLYRIIQELFQNVIKHANASLVHLQVTRARHRIHVVMEDNGDGFDPMAVGKGGMGLSNIEARVKKIGGQLSIDSTPGQGATFAIEIPD